MHRTLKSAYVLSVLIPLVLGAVDAANGAAILLSDDRQIRADAFVEVSRLGGTDSDADTALGLPFPPFAPWTQLVVASASVGSNTTIATASQSSTITPTLFTGTLFGEVDTDAGGDALGVGEATSEVLVGFELATPHSFVLTAILQESVSTFPPGVWLTFGPHAFSGRNDEFSATGVLGPGVYDFRAIAFGSVLGRSTGDAFHSQIASFEFAMTDLGPGQVPEPSALILLAAAVAGAGWFRRRRQVRSGDA